MTSDKGEDLKNLIMELDLKQHQDFIDTLLFYANAARYTWQKTEHGQSYCEILDRDRGRKAKECLERNGLKAKTRG